METTRFAVPTSGGKLCLHFGHCDQFAIIDAQADGTVTAQEMLNPPPHEPGLLPRWLGEKNVNMVIAGGMGQRAQVLFNQQNITVVTGAPVEDPETLVKAYLAQTLTTGANACSH